MLTLIDYLVLIGTLGLIVGYGIFKTRQKQSVDSYIRGGQETPWWAIGLGIMATQASAITFLSVPGQAYQDGLRFIQFYFGLPLAMIVLSISAVPIFSKLKVLTAYQYLEDRFGRKTRTLASGLFLLQRGLSTGITIYAPSIILSTVLGWSLNWTILVIGITVTLYTWVGGNKAVSVTHRQQMLVIFSGLFIAAGVIIHYLPSTIGLSEATHLAGLSGKLNAIDWSFNLKDRYNIWSGLIGGFFLQLSYFGTDQSQVGRYINGAPISESRMGLLMNGLVKIPMQLFILGIGILVYVFFLFAPTPLHFNQVEADKVAASHQGEWARLERKHKALEDIKIGLAKRISKGEIRSLDADNQLVKELNAVQQEIQANRQEAKGLFKADKQNDADYVFIQFILSYLPHGLIGLLLAVILSAAMSSTSSALTSLGNTSVVDIYHPILKDGCSDDKLVSACKISTVGWGLVAMGFALVASLIDNLIQAVNILGSLFYGVILGIFLVGFYFKKIGGRAVFWSAIVSEIIVGYCFMYVDSISYLWYNVIGCMAVVLVGYVIELVAPESEKTQAVS